MFCIILELFCPYSESQSKTILDPIDFHCKDRKNAFFKISSCVLQNKESCTGLK